jgi:putative two-component system response regulator
MSENKEPFPGGAHMPRLLIVDDEPANIKLLDKMLRGAGYNDVLHVSDPREVLPLYHAQGADVILLDLNMPHLDGFEVLARLKALNDPLLPPILVLTAQHGNDHRLRALKEGARDYVTKPFDRAELLARVRNLVEVQRLHVTLRNQNKELEARVHDRTRELRQTRLEIVRRLGRAAEFRDNETGFHILRMSHTSVLLARAVGWDDDQCELLLHASPMHDIGKIGIPDHILLKPGKLDPQEWETMKTHTEIGARILDGSDSALLILAREIAMTHHEKWDGSGYPHGLAGEGIPQAGRITAIADVFDALTSERPYKKAWPLEQAIDYISENRGRHFDPVLAEHFLRLLPEVQDIRARYVEPEAA